MRYRSRAHCLVLLIAASIARVASGQADGVSPVAERVELRLGDIYTVDVDGAAGPQRFSGDLVKANERWLVLRRDSEARHDVSVPVSSKVPYLKRKKVEVSPQTEYFWIPRPAAQVVSRSPPEGLRPLDDHLGDNPAIGAACDVTFATDNKRSAHNIGKLVVVAKDRIMFDAERKVYEQQEVPVLGELPLVGRAFRRREAHVEIVREELPLKTITCIRFVRAGATDADAPVAKPAAEK
ncbi:MAG: hypothetical protein ABUL64_04590 [Singulisphaera sp.]